MRKLLRCAAAFVAVLTTVPASMDACAGMAARIEFEQGAEGAAAAPGNDDAGIAYGPHGGVVDLPAGAYVCIVYEPATRRCLVRALSETEIVTAIQAGGDPNGAPVWMRASVDLAVSAFEPGLPLDNEYGLPGLLTTNLSTAEVALVRCLANSSLGRPPSRWDDANVYRDGTVERCAEENGFGGETPSLPQPVLPLAARHIQEAVAIVSGTQRLASANTAYANVAGRYADSTYELVSGPFYDVMPTSTPSMAKGKGYSVERGNRIVVDLNPQAADVCRALNLIHGRPWTSLPGRMPPGVRSGCYPTQRGFRYEFRE